jgi:hypothetical protein
MLSLIPWWLKLIIVGALAVGAYFAWEHYVANPYRAQGRAEVQAKWDADRDARIKRTTEIVLELSGKLMEAKDAQAAHERQLDAVFAVVEADVGRIRSTGAGIRLPADVIRVLDESSDAANSGRPATDGTGKARADPLPAATEAAAYDERELGEFLKQSALAYADAYGLWHSCRVREDSLRDALAKGTNP